MAPVVTLDGARLCLADATRVLVVICSCRLRHETSAAVCGEHAVPPPSNAQCIRCGNLPARNDVHRCDLTLTSNKSILEL